MKKIKIIQKTDLGIKDVYDIGVKDSHHYVLSNGVVSHNSYISQQISSGGTGVIYSPSIILMMSKAGLKDGDKEAEAAGMTKSGIVVTFNPEKNRFAKPIKIKTHISFFHGMNPYVGLQQFLDYDKIGIGPGTLIPKIEKRPTLDENGKQVIYRNKPKFEEIETGEFEYVPDTSEKPKYYAVKHLGMHIKGNLLFSHKVFTDEILKMMDEEIIKPLFSLPKISDDIIEEIEDIFGDSSEDKDELDNSEFEL